MLREAEGYLAGVCATYLVDRLALAGVVAGRTASWTADEDSEAGFAAFMIREVAQIYGHRPNSIAVFRLLRSALVTASVGAAIEVIGRTWTEHIANRIAGVLATQAAESLTVGIRMARLGLTTMALCRPLRFSSEEEPELLDVLRQALQGSK